MHNLIAKRRLTQANIIVKCEKVTQNVQLEINDEAMWTFSMTIDGNPLHLIETIFTLDSRIYMMKGKWQATKLGEF